MAVIKHKDQRVGVLIDAQNLYHSAKNLYSCKVNFGAVLGHAVAERKLIRALAYVISTESGDETTFFEALTKTGIETKTKDLQVFYGGQKKADWDVGIAVDAIRMAPKLDTIILVTGDGDFAPLVEYLKFNEGVQVEVVSFGQSTSSKLKEVTDAFLDLSLEPQKFLINYRPQFQQRKEPRIATIPQAPKPLAVKVPIAPTQTTTQPTVKTEDTMRNLGEQKTARKSFPKKTVKPKQ